MEWGQSIQSAQNTLAPPPTRRVGYLPSRMTSFGPSWVAHGPGMVFFKHCSAEGTSNRRRFRGKNPNQNDYSAHQGSPTPKTELLESPQGSFKHAKRGWTALRAYTYVVLAVMSTNMLTFAPTPGLAWWEMVRLCLKYGYEAGPKLHEPCS